MRTYKDLQFIVGQDIGHGLLRNRVMDYNCPQAEALNMEKNTKKDTLNHTAAHTGSITECSLPVIYTLQPKAHFYIFFPVFFKTRNYCKLCKLHQPCRRMQTCR